VSAMDGVEAAAEEADIHSGASCEPPLVSSLAGGDASAVVQIGSFLADFVPGSFAKDGI
jgi:hypothetical protein